MNILFVNISGLRFNVLTPEQEPLGGSESSLCYLARVLAARGHRVTLLAHLPAGTPPVLAGVQHRPAVTAQDAGFFAAAAFDAIVICNRALAAPSLRDISPHSRLLLWTHVLPEHAFMQACAEPEVQAALDGLVYVSHWQRGKTEAHFGTAQPATVIGNGLTPAFENMFASPAELLAAKEPRAAYTTTPFRGLPVLLQALAGEAAPPLAIYSSMRVYQVATAADPYADLYRQAAENPLVTVHGAVTQPALAQALRPVAFLTYPSIYAETFCNVALEAMAAGMQVLATDYGALLEVTQGTAELIPVKPTLAELAADFRALIRRSVVAYHADPQAWAAARFAQLQAVNRDCSWNVRAEMWERLLMAGY